MMYAMLHPYITRMIDPTDEWAPNGIDHDVEQHHIVKRIEIVMEVMEQC